MSILLDWGGFFNEVLYKMFSSIDAFIYGIAGSCFNLLEEIYTFDFFGGATDIINQIRNKVYMVLGILMMFKIILAGIQYIINPDTFDDKEKGLVGILKNGVITVLLIAVVPVIFEFALYIQTDIVKSIPKIIFSKESAYAADNEDNSVGENKLNGNDVAFTVLQGFVSPSKEHGVDLKVGLGTCKENTDNICDFESFKNNIYAGVKDGTGKYEYMFLISTLAGGFLIFILLSMALDIAIRTIKLGIIQMLSPIPISSYMFKKDNFNKFVKTSAKVYADLFIRMAIIYVVILSLQILISSGILNITRGTDDGKWFEAILTNLIFIFGLLMFAKKAPKFVTDLIGLPDVTNDEISGMFKRAGGLAGATGSMLTAGVSNFANQYSQAKSKYADANGKVGLVDKLKAAAKASTKGTPSTFAGMASAGFRGTRAAYNGKGMKETFKAGHSGAIGARTNRAIAKSKGTAGFGAMMERARIKAQDFAGIVTDVSLMESQQKAMSSVGSAEKSEIGRVNDIISRNAAAIDANHGDIAGGLHNDRGTGLVDSVIKDLGATIETIEVDGKQYTGVNGIKNEEVRKFVESVLNGEKVSVAQVLSHADYTGDDAELKLLSTLLSSSGDYRSNLHKNATQQAYNGGVFSMEDALDDAGNVIGQKTFGKLDSKSSSFDTQLQGFHNNLMQSFINNADSLGVLANSLKKYGLEQGQGFDKDGNRVNSKETIAQFLERAYTAQTRDFESAVDEANTIISSAGPRAQRESAIREDMKRREQNKSKNG